MVSAIISSRFFFFFFNDINLETSRATSAEQSIDIFQDLSYNYLSISVIAEKLRAVGIESFNFSSKYTFNLGRTSHYLWNG